MAQNYGALIGELVSALQSNLAAYAPQRLNVAPPQLKTASAVDQLLGTNFNRSRQSIFDELASVINTAYATSMNEQRDNERAYLQALANVSDTATDTMRNQYAADAAMGANMGMQAANALSAILGMQNNSMTGLNDLFGNRSTLVNQKANDLAGASKDATDLYNTLQQYLADFSKSLYETDSTIYTTELASWNAYIDAIMGALPYLTDYEGGYGGGYYGGDYYGDYGYYPEEYYGGSTYGNEVPVANTFNFKDAARPLVGAAPYALSEKGAQQIRDYEAFMNPTSLTDLAYAHLFPGKPVGFYGSGIVDDDADKGSGAHGGAGRTRTFVGAGVKKTNNTNTAKKAAYSSAGSGAAAATALAAKKLMEQKQQHIAANNRAAQSIAALYTDQVNKQAAKQAAAQKTAANNTASGMAASASNAASQLAQQLAARQSAAQQAAAQQSAAAKAAQQAAASKARPTVNKSGTTSNTSNAVNKAATKPAVNKSGTTSNTTASAKKATNNNAASAAAAAAALAAQRAAAAKAAQQAAAKKTTNTISSSKKASTATKKSAPKVTKPSATKTTSKTNTRVRK